AALARVVELALDGGDAQGVGLARNVEDALALEVRAAVHAPVPGRVLGIGGAEHVAKLVGTPHEELALVALGIRVLRRVETAGGGGGSPGAGCSRASPRTRAGTPDRRARASGAGRARRAGRCRTASSRSGARASARRPSSGGSPRRPGRTSRRAPSSSGSCAP